jgi:hypothetical protein
MYLQKVLIRVNGDFTSAFTGCFCPLKNRNEWLLKKRMTCSGVSFRVGRTFVSVTDLERSKNVQSSVT